MMIIENYQVRTEENPAGRHRIVIDTKIGTPGGQADVVITIGGAEAARTTVLRTVPAAWINSSARERVALICAIGFWLHELLLHQGRDPSNKEPHGLRGDQAFGRLTRARSSAARTLRPSSAISASVMISGGAITKQPASGLTITPSASPAS